MKRKEARESAFLLLFEAAARPEECGKDIYEAAVTERELPADDYVKQVFFGVEEHKDDIEALTDACLIGWKKNRLSTVSVAILRLGAYEMLYTKDIPAKVTINEGIELSKKYDDEKAYAFINGVLNAMAEKTGKKDA